jgi:hypothetical protein
VTATQDLVKEVLVKIDAAINECSGKTLVDASTVVDMLLDIRHPAVVLLSVEDDPLIIPLS